MTVPRRGLGDLTLLAGVVLGSLGFVLGGFAALVAVPGIFFSRLRAPALACFCTTVLCAGLSMFGINPWGSFIRNAALDELEAALGARPGYTAARFNPAAGTLRFDNLDVDLPGLGGNARVVSVTIEGGPGMLPGMGSRRISARGLRIVVDGRSDFERFLGGLPQTGPDTEVDLETIELLVQGPQVDAAVLISSARGTTSTGNFEVHVAPRQLDLTLWQQTHSLQVRGAATFARQGGRSKVALDLKVADQDVLSLYAHGTLQPDPGAGGLQITVDYIDLQQLWARYRKIDVWAGTVRGNVFVSGSLSELRLDMELSLAELSYFHRAVMALDESRAFLMPAADLNGRIRMRDGESFTLEGLLLVAPECSLCTGPYTQASGEGILRLDGTFPALQGTLAATVRRGTLSRPITWSPAALYGLPDMQPNLVQVAEQFTYLDLDFGIEIDRLDVACEPLTGWLAGELSGNLRKVPGRKDARLSVGGNLDLKDGRFAFCAAAGEVAGTIEFNPNIPSYEAGIRGTLKGVVSSTTLSADITGRLSHPGLAFTGVLIPPDDLGRLIALHADGSIDAAEKGRRTESITRLCGPAAAIANNPFLAQRGGRVSFSFRP